MPVGDRRTVLATLGWLTLGTTGGCLSWFDPPVPAGSLRFRNDHHLPHTIRLAVTGVGEAPGDGPGNVTGDVIVPPAQRELTSASTLEPGETETYEEVFAEPVYYGIQFELDGEEPGEDAGTVVFNPAPPDGDGGQFLEGRVYESGEFSWVVSGTDNMGDVEG